MTPDKFIDAAIAIGSRDGLARLDQDQRFVFLVSEAEVLCDMEGIDSLIQHYGPGEILECAKAFETIGAVEIAEGLKSIAVSLPNLDDALLERVNDLITRRSGYDYDAISRAVQLCLSRRTM